LRDRAVPTRFARVPPEGDTGASVFIVRFDDESLAVVSQMRNEVDRHTVTSDPSLAHERRPRHVLPNDRSFVVAEQARPSLVREHGKERFLVRDLAAKAVRDAD